MKKLLFTTIAISGLFFSGCSKPAETSTSTNTTTTAVTASASPVAVATPATSGTPTAATPGAGEEVVLEDIGIKYTIPADWKKDAEGDLSADEGKISVIFIKPPDGKLEEVAKSLDQELGKALTDIKAEGEGSEHEVGGIKSFTTYGTAKLKDGGQEVDWSVEILGVKKPLIVLEVSAKGSYEANQASYDAFESSFTSLDGAGEEAPGASGTPGAEETPEASETPAE
ncbi:hypothetical protein JST97_36150 [bacterium]|nr:hypothetical protein [bacterium]